MLKICSDDGKIFRDRLGRMLHLHLSLCHEVADGFSSFCGWQSSIAKGSMTANRWIGDDKHTKSGMLLNWWRLREMRVGLSTTVT
jgi:hypothetical protein